MMRAKQGPFAAPPAETSKAPKMPGGTAATVNTPTKPGELTLATFLQIQAQSSTEDAAKRWAYFINVTGDQLGPIVEQWLKEGKLEPDPAWSSTVKEQELEQLEKIGRLGAAVGGFYRELRQAGVDEEHSGYAVCSLVHSINAH